MMLFDMKTHAEKILPANGFHPWPIMWLDAERIVYGTFSPMAIREFNLATEADRLIWKPDLKEEGNRHTMVAECTLSPKGDKVAYTVRYDYWYDMLFVEDLESSETRLLLNEGKKMMDISFSPDGEAILLLDEMDNRQEGLITGTISVVDLDAGAVEALVNTETLKVLPRDPFGVDD